MNLNRYAFMVGFVAPAAERNFTLANWNNAASPRPPALADADDTYPGGWGLRREGNGVTPPRMIAGDLYPGARELIGLRYLRGAACPGTKPGRA